MAFMHTDRGCNCDAGGLWRRFLLRLGWRDVRPCWY